MATAVEIAWAAGLFEGEGCISVQRAGIKSKYNQVRLLLSSTDKDVIDRFGSYFGGNITVKDRSKNLLSRKPLWEWSLGGRKDVARVLGLIGPYLGERRTAKMADAYEVIAGMRTPGRPTGKHLRPISHGTPTGYGQHIKRKVPMCELCRQARARYYQEWMAQRESAAWSATVANQGA